MNLSMVFKRIKTCTVKRHGRNNKFMSENVVIPKGYTDTSTKQPHPKGLKMEFMLERMAAAVW